MAATQERIMTPRRQIGEHDKAAFQYPFNSCPLPENDEEGWCHTHLEERPIPHAPAAPVGDFPHHNIKRWIWSAAGKNDEEPWEALVELEEVEWEYDTDEEKAAKKEHNKAPRFAFFFAWCDYTGFDCQGDAFVTVARDIPTLIQFAMGEAAYKRYIKGTEPADAW